MEKRPTNLNIAYHLPPPMTADPELEQAFELFRKGDMEHSVPVLLQYAEEGDPEVQSFVGTLYASGEGVEKDLEEANNWFSAAASQGFGDAEYNLGYDYMEGLGVEKDEETAFDLFSRAAEHGSAMGALHEAMCVAEGRGTEKDEKKGEELLSLSERSEDTAVLSRLGLFYYESGRYVRAAVVLRKAADRGDPFSQYLLGTMYIDRLGVQKDDREARKWLGKAAKAGIPEAVEALGELNG